MQRNRGFTLIEVMITLAIIAVLATIALPGYEEYMRRGRRADAQAFLQDVAARQQHFLVDRRAYGTSVTAAPSAGGLGLTVPSAVSSYYTVALVTDNTARPPTFSVTATPKGSQASDKCGTLAVNQTGNRSATGTGACW